MRPRTKCAASLLLVVLPAGAETRGARAESIYWADQNSSSGVSSGDIRRANRDGTDMETLISGLTEPPGITLSPSAVPEPANLTLLVIGAVGLLSYAARWRTGTCA
jgi:hypothetical protein